MKLRRTRQCRKCPWRASVDPRDIPDGYSEEKHRDLERTIAEPGAINIGPIDVMACHETGGSRESPCLGWLANQLGPGNNIALRILAAEITNLDRVRLDGPQHPTFADTLPNRDDR